MGGVRVDDGPRADGEPVGVWPVNAATVPSRTVASEGSTVQVTVRVSAADARTAGSRTKGVGSVTVAVRV